MQAARKHIHTVVSLPELHRAPAAHAKDVDPLRVGAVREVLAAPELYAIAVVAQDHAGTMTSGT